MTTTTIRERLEYLRGELRAERISYDELHELQSLALHIDPDDVELLEAAGVPETTPRFSSYLDEAAAWIADAAGDSDDPMGADVFAANLATAAMECRQMEATHADLLAALEEAERVIRWAAQESQGRVKSEIVGGWLHHAKKARAAIAAATAR